ncbi:MAG: preprotein translocase subunit SecG [bacterium]|nr:preprotein translocase subunit SecG [bacterium]MDT8396800.1 preprotein translocase subunit SecG [bacterium]
MILFLKILHIAVAVFLILVVLLQTGKGAEMGAAFGGSSQTLFGGAGPAGFMAKLTTTAAICFMLTSLGLAYMSSTSSRNMGIEVPTTQAPVTLPGETGAGQVPEEAVPESSAPTSATPETAGTEGQ